LLAGDRYRFEFDVGFVDPTRSPTINISFFGTSSCDNLPFGSGQPDLGCPTNGPNWIKLGSRVISGGSGNQWVKGFIDVTPGVDINAIAIGPDCPTVPSDVGLYYFFDNLLLSDFESFEFRITPLNHPCADEFTLQIPFRDNLTYQWYKNGIALLGETLSSLRSMHGDGSYEVVIDDGSSCKVATAFSYIKPEATMFPNISICYEDTYPFGNLNLQESGRYVDTFKNVNNCDSIVVLQLTVLGAVEDTVSAKIFEDEAYEVEDYAIRRSGQHMLQLTSTIGCDSLVLLNLDFYNVFIPNAFSPNGDGINDRFTVLGGEDLSEVIELRIYDRWGKLMANGTTWDGKVDSEEVNPGVFAYIAKLRMDDGKERTRSGTFVLTR
jgi:gliding motility-associated-like protein